jgi:branched-chain amino acid transport system substrate-binding protein
MWSYRPAQQRVLLVALALGVIVFMTACSSSSKPKASSPTTTKATATGSPLLLGDIADESGPCLPNSQPDQGNALNAWASYINAHGGVAGHVVHVTTIDTQCNPANVATAAQTLIADHALAIIDGTGLDAAFQKNVDAAKVPVICGIQNGNGFTCQSDANFFPSGTTVLSGIYGYMEAAKAAGATSYGLVYCSEVPACKQAVPVSQGYAKQLGMSFPNPIAASLSASNYTAQCLAMKQAHANALDSAGPPVQKMADDCAQQDYHPIYPAGSGTWQNNYLRDPNLNGTITGDTVEVPWFYKGPQTATFDAAEGSVLAATNYPYNVSTTYAAALLFATALAHAGANPTTSDLYNGLYAMHGETLGGYAPPLTFTQGKPTTVNCFFVISIKNGQFVAPNGATPTCQPTAGASSS